MKTLQRGIWLVAGILLTGLFGNTHSAGAEPRSIQEFMKYQDRWDSFVLTEYAWQLEGRYSGITDGTLTFTNCPLPFRLSPEQINNRDGSGVVEVTGVVIREEKGLAFKVRKLTPRPRDLDLLRRKRFGIDAQKPEDWYQLAEWVRGRSDFYKDKDLARAAVDLDRNGVLAELRQLQPRDEQGSAALLQKARDKQLDSPLIQQLTHHLLQTRYRTLLLQEDAAPSWKELQQQIQRELVKGNKPLATFPAELNARYQELPGEVYAAASASERETLGRLFLIETILHQLLQVAHPDGSNGFDIADRIQAEIPERSDLLKKYFELAVSWNLQKIGTCTRTQLDELTRRLEQRGEKNRAEAAKESWLSVRESIYRQDGARGLADLAELWMTLLNNESKAARLMMDAWADNPQYAPATDWLTAHGYRLIEGKWLSEIEMAAMPEDPRKAAIREGRVEVGMTAADVFAALGTAPSSLTRSVSRRQVTEWWIYQDAGIIVQLVKGSRERESHVVSIDKLSPAMTVDP